MGQRGRQVGAAEFGRVRQIDKLEAWLAELAAGARPGRAQEPQP
jgi:hypothetical protein